MDPLLLRLGRSSREDVDASRCGRLMPPAGRLGGRALLRVSAQKQCSLLSAALLPRGSIIEQHPSIVDCLRNGSPSCTNHRGACDSLVHRITRRRMSVFEPARDVHHSLGHLRIELARPAPRHRVTPKLVHEILGPALSSDSSGAHTSLSSDAIFRGFI
jgi:hypothetical protein